MLKRTFTVLVSSLAMLSGHHVAAEAVAMNPENFQIVDEEHRFEKHLGRDALFLSGKGEAGSFAVVKGMGEQQDGTLEFDVAFPKGHAFVGSVFRLQSNLVNGEMVYLRAHQSGHPDASQYMPIYGGQEAWQLYTTQGHYARRMSYDFDQWMHVKIAVADGLGEFYVKDMKTPKMVMPLDHTPKAGAWTLYAAITPHGAHYSNVSYSTEKPVLNGTGPKPVKTPAGTITRWHLSDAFAEKYLKGAQLPEAIKNLKWTTSKAEASGLVHISKTHGASVLEGKNTVLAKVILTAKEDMVKRLDFGFSDRVKVYLNGQLLFSANDMEGTRDARFLGTMGYFDALYLALKKGDNELLLAVSEIYGGWGVQGKLENFEGLEVK